MVICRAVIVRVIFSLKLLNELLCGNISKCLYILGAWCYLPGIKDEKYDITISDNRRKS